MLKYYIMKKFQILVMLLWLSVCLAGAVESKIRLVHGPYLQNLGPDEVTIVWLSDKPSVGWVELAPDDDTNFYATERPKYYDARNGVKNTSTIHTVKIKGLKPGTNYRYRVFVQEVLAMSDIRSSMGTMPRLMFTPKSRWCSRRAILRIILSHLRW